ncbi:MAG TPA: preprotein translocase subunit SecE [Methylothermaceae bacterium]|nr:preprotein translocase subunit SecE [Methylothermaceae bacterium]
MAAQAQSSESSLSVLDWMKLTIVIGLLAAGVMGYYHYAHISLLYRVLALVGVGLAAAGIFFTTNPGQAFWAFFQEARNEVRKVAWPTRQETIHTTLMVVLMVFIVGVILWLLDTFFLWLVRLLTGQGG